MRESIRTVLLVTAGLLVSFAAVTTATVSIPHLRGDLVEINVRPTLLKAVAIAMDFGMYAMFAFACVVAVAAIQSLRGRAFARSPLLIIAVLYIGFGTIALAGGSGHHMYGYIAIGALLIGAAVI